ncbi:hypothetical protein [Jiangella muralis]|uniref:hypothetical protein n=1 Tax=Jiangella muralis TaxID=702383 RepID=UPI0012F84425|nr:hypothetical protein [Jiangella muralis]
MTDEETTETRIVGLGSAGGVPMCVHVDGFEHEAERDKFGFAMLDPECTAGPEATP